MDPLDWIMASIAFCGTFGLLVIGFTERFVPVIPSYAMLLSIGVAAGDGIWPLSLALLTITLGGIVGCVGSLYSLRLIGRSRSETILNGASRMFGIPAGRRERILQAYHRNQTTLAFSLQLVPTVRLFTPIFAVLMGGSALGFVAASSIGILAYNVLFVGIGYLASSSVADANTTILAFAVLACVIVAQMAVVAVARKLMRYRAAAQVPVGQ